MSDNAHDQPLPEPNTPLWLPALGAALFSLAGIGWAICPGTPPAPPPTEAAPAPTVTVPPAPTAAAPRPPHPFPHPPTAAGSASAGPHAVRRPVLHAAPKH